VPVPAGLGLRETAEQARVSRPRLSQQLDRLKQLPFALADSGNAGRSDQPRDVFLVAKAAAPARRGWPGARSGSAALLPWRDIAVVLATCFGG